VKVLIVRPAELARPINGKKSSAAGDRTRIFRVTGGDTDHYTTATDAPFARAKIILNKRAFVLRRTVQLAPSAVHDDEETVRASKP